MGINIVIYRVSPIIVTKFKFLNSNPVGEGSDEETRTPPMQSKTSDSEEEIVHQKWRRNKLYAEPARTPRNRTREAERT